MKTKQKIKIGISPIAWSNDDLKELGGETSLQTFLEDAKNIGFDGVELGHKFPKDKYALKDILQQYDLELAGGWFSGNLLIHSLEEEQALLLPEIQRRVFCGCRNIVYAECSNTIQGKPIALSKKPVLDSKAIKQYAEKYSLLHAFAKEHGVDLAYHHHMGAIIQTPEEIDVFLSHLSHGAGLTFDTGHYCFAAKHVSSTEVLQGFKQCQAHIHHIHFKDVREHIKAEVLKNDTSFLQAVLDGIYTTPGDGMIDFAPIIECIKDMNYEGWIVIEAEQDPKKADPYIYSKKAFAMIAKLLEKEG